MKLTDDPRDVSNGLTISERTTLLMRNEGMSLDDANAAASELNKAARAFSMANPLPRPTPPPAAVRMKKIGEITDQLLAENPKMGLEEANRIASSMARPATKEIPAPQAYEEPADRDFRMLQNLFLKSGLSPSDAVREARRTLALKAQNERAAAHALVRGRR